MLKISFFLSLEWLKAYLRKTTQFVAIEIGHNFIFSFYSESFLSLA